MLKLWFLLPLTALITAMAQTFIKLASQDDLYRYGLSGKTLLVLIGNPYVWGSALFYSASFLLSFKIFQMANLSIISPVFMGLVLAMVVSIACLFFGEKLHLRIVLGQLMILGGIFLVLYRT